MSGPRLGFCALILAILLDCTWIGLQLRSSSAPGAQGPVEASLLPGHPSTSLGKSADIRSAAVLPPGVPRSAQLVRVVDHVDGDTLKVSVPVSGATLQRTAELTVRLLEIDTPESVDPSEPVQCFARPASAALTRLLPIGSKAWAVRDRQLLDPYNRELLYIWTGDGTFVNLDLVKRGYARAVLYEPNDAFIGVMRQAQKEAKSSKLGLWSHCDYFGAPLDQRVSRPSSPTRAQSHSTSKGLDPRFPYCSDANAAGYGNYVANKDPEYSWYYDADSDGIVCEF